MENNTPLSLRLLVVDTNDTCRTYIAKEMFKQFFEVTPVEFHIATAGTQATTGKKATEAAVKALKDYGVSIMLPDFESTALATIIKETPFDIVIALDTTVDKRHNKVIKNQPSEVLKNEYKHLYKKMVVWTGIEPYQYIHSEEKEERYKDAVEKLLRKVREFTGKWLKSNNFTTDKIMLYTGLSKHEIVNEL
jgi:protein-tyrosine-phosphatase